MREISMEKTLINGKPLSFYFQHLAALKTIDQDLIKDLIEEFPYSAHLHLLNTIKDHLENPEPNQDLLERASLYITDRRKLGAWINKLQSLQQDESLFYSKDYMESLTESLRITEDDEEVEISEMHSDLLVEEFDSTKEDFAVEDSYDDSDFPSNEDWTTTEQQVVEMSSDTVQLEEYNEGEQEMVGHDEEPEDLTEDDPLPSDDVIHETEETDEAISADLDDQQNDLEESDLGESESDKVILVDEEEEIKEEAEMEEGHTDILDEPSHHYEDPSSPKDNGDSLDMGSRLDSELRELEDARKEAEEELEVRRLEEKEVEEVADFRDQPAGAGKSEKDKGEEGAEEDEEEFETPFLRWLQRLQSAETGSYVDMEAEREKTKGSTRKEKSKKKKKKKKKGQKKKKQKKKKKKRWKLEALQPDESLVSEALADLLADQGHTGRAIEMYKKLRLTIPQKSVFFAQKIKALKK